MGQPARACICRVGRAAWSSSTLLVTSATTAGSTALRLGEAFLLIHSLRRPPRESSHHLGRGRVCKWVLVIAASSAVRCNGADRPDVARPAGSLAASAIRMSWRRSCCRNWLSRCSCCRHDVVGSQPPCFGRRRDMRCRYSRDGTAGGSSASAPCSSSRPRPAEHTPSDDDDRDSLAVAAADSFRRPTRGARQDHRLQRWRRIRASRLWLVAAA